MHNLNLAAQDFRQRLRRPFVRDMEYFNARCRLKQCKPNMYAGTVTDRPPTQLPRMRLRISDQLFRIIRCGRLHEDAGI